MARIRIPPRNNFVNDRVGETSKKEATDIRFIRQSFQIWKLERVIPNLLQRGIHGGKELHSEAASPIFVPLGRLLRFLFGLGIDAEVHEFALETSD
jgi:hypothetical protein